MKWIGYISTIILLQIICLGIFLQIFGKLPWHELGLAWQAILSEPPSATKAPAETPPPPEIPSYEDLLQERLLASPEIARKIDELNAVRRAVDDDQKKLEVSRKELLAIRTKLENKVQTEIDKARIEGEAKLLELVQTMKPKQARDYLVTDSDEDRVLRLLIAMDPSTAEKIFREFKQPEDQRKLNGWLDRLGQGDPEAQRLRKLKEDTQKQTVS